ncbi:MAG: type 2 isopentenyl-diphosphate Delta-isomerase [Desulfurococcales archaeon]|nr:type 2 isopentenyl-diphosphate Delta-isomerase [Desulfurococcales archaeon]
MLFLSTSSRKVEHVRLVASSKVESSESTLFEFVRLVHNPMPGLDLSDVDLSVSFCGGRRLRAPLMITGMTGGHPDVSWINEKLAMVAEEFGIAMGVGSQRAALEDPSLSETYSIARRVAPNAVLVANIGAPQLARGYGVREVLRAIEMIDADAIAIHLNPGQEAFQDEGEPLYRGVLEKIVDVASRVDKPVIVKEVGTGLSREVVAELYQAGVECFDVAGLGGTNWVKAEVIRSRAKHGSPLKPAGGLDDYWGNPTAVAVVEARVVAPRAFIVGSGGVRNGLDVVKVIALGADVAGMALPALRALVNGGYESLRKLISSIIYQVKVAVFLVGGRSVKDLWKAPVVVHGRLREELELRGVNVDEYIREYRLKALLWRVKRESGY